ncbi:2-phosphosulfolactate phosphatase [Actinokineospora guangxiensis]|uniref:Probable 2-phosphosulfolactate phosphatase n=1 Tax=Actinokineospora guangxiensis TaxID=1490288 RepID=A0ABW0EJ15_9PSEU
MTNNPYAQTGFEVRLDWGPEGMAALAECPVVVIVDVLSFSTSVDIAVSRGARVLPLPWRFAGAEKAAAAQAAKDAGAVLAGDGPWTLRPASLTSIPAGTLLALPSPNGATLSTLAGGTVLAGCLRNAPAVAAAARAAGGPVAVIAGGERWRPQNTLRPAVEDLLGAGAIAHHLGGGLSPEARAAEAAFLAYGDDLPAVLAASASGRELTEWGHAGDVALASAYGVSATVPRLVDGVYS